jgi:hypothetical protein
MGGKSIIISTFLTVAVNIFYTIISTTDSTVFNLKQNHIFKNTQTLLYQVTARQGLCICTYVC